MKNQIQFFDKITKGKHGKAITPDIQVMVLGARRVGKTSVLASMVNQFNAVTKDTNMHLDKLKGVAVNNALDTMKGYFKEGCRKYDIVKMDDNATPGFDEFYLQLGISGKKAKKPKTICFKDCSGEWINQMNNEEELGKTIEKSEVIMIAIDSVILMEKNGKYNEMNHMGNVTDFVINHVNKEPGKNKMILFVPLKCEKYYHENMDQDSSYYKERMKQLNERIKEEYADLLGYLTKPANRNYFTVVILPILTLGGIEFDSFDENEINSQDELSLKSIKYRYCEPMKFNPLYCEKPLIYTLLFEMKKIDSICNKKGIPEHMIDWIKSNMKYVKDADYVDELQKLEKLVEDDHYKDEFDFIQNPLGL